MPGSHLVAMRLFFFLFFFGGVSRETDVHIGDFRLKAVLTGFRKALLTDFSRVSWLPYGLDVP